MHFRLAEPFRIRRRRDEASLDNTFLASPHGSCDSLTCGLSVRFAIAAARRSQQMPVANWSEKQFALFRFESTELAQHTFDDG